jgi:hypothetical protein
VARRDRRGDGDGHGTNEISHADVVSDKLAAEPGRDHRPGVEAAHADSFPDFAQKRVATAMASYWKIAKGAKP